MNEIRIFSRFTHFQSFSFYFLIFRQGRTYFSAIHHGLLISNITLVSICTIQIKFQHKKGIYTYKTDFHQHRFTFFISQSPNIRTSYFFVQFLWQDSTQKFLSIHISHTFILEFLLSHCFFYFAWFDSHKLLFTCSSFLTICIHTTIIDSL